MSNFMLLEGGQPGTQGALLPLILPFAVLIVFYFIMIRPQKKQQKQLQALLSTVATGDSVLTSSGFYGVVIDVMDDIVIVEFGNNKNCRIPMKKNAIIEIEKQSTEKN